MVQGRRQIVVWAKAGEGIVSSQGYFDVIKGKENASFKMGWARRYGLKYPIISSGVGVWNAVHFWAKALESAKTTEVGRVIKELERGITIRGPSVLSLGKSHHTKQNIYLVRTNRAKKFEVIKVFKDVDPEFLNEVCDVIENPRLAKHFVPYLSA